MILSSFVGPSDDLKYEAKLPPTNLKVPFFWGHGHADAVVPFAFGKVGVDQLKQVGVGAVCLVHSLSRPVGCQHSAALHPRCENPKLQGLESRICGVAT